MKTIHSPSYQRLIGLLIEARKEAKMTQQGLSSKLGRQQSYVSKYERGERRLDVIEFLQVTLNLDADPYRLLKEIEPLLRAPAKGTKSLQD
ncbi:helix-turn-helix domain-containing protein [Azomonas macrocytogenes]|uniref:Transcriptional regulator with XRE-family HTH domain n=1 Tax=Azomonas macrocytogenes TaxID=69962 RepID=A0A839T7Z8_AZOMA|nr:helix-turn-helix transcriptional regulator [Azomonas macrocytogenes]MBB3105219.1 transcriptional regulator with XRE-family HTH domain [Azomonas macrocytogenes]